MPDPASAPLPPALADERRTAAPWLRLIGAIGAAGDPRALLLAVVGLLLTLGGWSALDRAFGQSPGTTRVSAFGPGRVEGWEGPPTSPAGAAWAIADPLRVVLGPMAEVFAIDQGNATFARALLAAAWGLVVWGAIGGTIARIAVARAGGIGEGIGLMTAVRFVVRRAGSLVAAPLGTLLAVGLLAVPGALIGLLYWDWPGGPGTNPVAGFLLGLPLLLAVPSAMLLIGLAAGWPLMVLTIAAEGEDGFDAIGRSFSYLSRRPGHYAAAVLVSWASGAVGLVLVSQFARLVVHLAGWTLAIGGPDDRLAPLFTFPPTPPAGGSPAHGIWMGLIGLVLSAWAYSFFWSAFARIYLLLRLEVDGTPWHDVYRPSEDCEPFAPEPTPPDPVAEPPLPEPRPEAE